MLNQFLPNQFVKNIFEISPDDLKKKGIKGIITDLDNTLVEWDRPLATPQIIEWFAEMKRNDIKVTIVSNNKEARVKSFSDPLHIPFIFAARKPLGRAFKKAIMQMNIKKEEAVVIAPIINRCSRWES